MAAGGLASKGAGLLKKPAFRIQATDVQTAALWGVAAGATAIWVVQSMKYSEITHHFHHPQHKLKLETSRAPFRCDGCKEMGLGSRYKCNLCDYDLHLQCALPSPTINHSFYIKCSFNFLSHPPGAKPGICNACRSDLKGFVYHCHKCGFDLHPCCAKLPMEKGFFTACSKLRSQGDFHGIFVWSADDSKKSQFLYEKQSLATGVYNWEKKKRTRHSDIIRPYNTCPFDWIKKTFLEKPQPEEK